MDQLMLILVWIEDKGHSVSPLYLISGQTPVGSLASSDLSCVNFRLVGGRSFPIFVECNSPNINGNLSISLLENAFSQVTLL
jgi:hypothetical protein